jgi:hypothetical protein
MVVVIMKDLPEHAPDGQPEDVTHLPRPGAAERRTYADWPTRPSADAWKGSIGEAAVRCMICGQESRILSAPHLRRHGGTRELYKEHFGIPVRESLMCGEVRAQRQEAMRETRAWECKPGGARYAPRGAAPEDEAPSRSIVMFPTYREDSLPLPGSGEDEGGPPVSLSEDDEFIPCGDEVFTNGFMEED